MSKKKNLRAKSLMLHGIGFVSGDPTVRIGYPFVYHPGVKVTVSEQGEAKWIYMAIPLCKGDLISGIKVAYRNHGMSSGISLLRIVEQSEPVSATVVHNVELDRNTAGFTVFSSPCNIIVNSSAMLKLCMDFGDASDVIEIGSVEVRFIPGYADTTEQEDSKQSQAFLPPTANGYPHGKWKQRLINMLCKDERVNANANVL